LYRYDEVTPGCELRLLELFYSKIYKLFPGTERIEGIDDQYWTLRAEEVTPDDVDDATTGAGADGDARSPAAAGGAGGGDKVIHVYHFYRDAQQQGAQVGGNQTVHNFGDPFLMRVGAEEPLSSVKRRVQAKLGTPDEEFNAWKWAYHSLGGAVYVDFSLPTA
jgi:ubiquitin carboxyl-terminal hydrolase 7